MAPKFDWDSLPDEHPTAKTGGKFNWDDQPDEHSDLAGAGQAALEHFGNSASLGYLPQMQALASQLTPDPSADTDAKLKAQGFKINQPQSSYVSDRDENIKRLNQQSEDHPYASAAGTVAGAIASGAAASGIAPINAASRIGRIAQAAKGGAILGAVSNPGDTEGQVAPGLQMSDRARNALTGGALGAAGQGAIEGLSAAAKGFTNLPATLKKMAEERAFNSTGATIKDYRLANKGGIDRVSDIGRYMHDNGMIQPGMTAQDIADAAKGLESKSGKAIGGILDQLDQSGAVAPTHEQLASAVEQMALPSKDLNTAQPTYRTLQDVAGDIRTLGKPKAPAAGTLEQLTGKGEEFLLDKEGNPIARFQDGKMVGDSPVSGSVSGGATVASNPNLSAGTFKGVQDVKNFINDQIESAGGWKAVTPSEKNLALRQVHKMIGDKLEQGADSAAQSVGDPELLKKYQAAKFGYGTSKELGKIATDQALKQKVNSISAGDKFSGGVGMLIGAMTGDSWEERAKHAAMGAGLGLINKAARTYGTPLVSTALDRAGGLLAKTPLSAAGELAAPLLRSAERSPTSLAATEGVLSRPSQFAPTALRNVASSPSDNPPQGGENHWAQNGLNKLSIQDPATVSRLLQSPQGKQLLIQASDLDPGSKAMQNIRNQIQKSWGKK